MRRGHSRPEPGRRRRPTSRAAPAAGRARRRPSAGQPPTPSTSPTSGTLRSRPQLGKPDRGRGRRPGFYRVKMRTGLLEACDSCRAIVRANRLVARPVSVPWGGGVAASAPSDNITATTTAPARCRPQPNPCAGVHAAELARIHGARLHVVSAYSATLSSKLQAERELLPEEERWMVSPGEQAERVLVEAAKTIEATTGVSVETHALPGDPAEVII